MTPEITLLSICIIAAILCVAVGVEQWRINQLHAENDRERARHEVTNELLTEARNEAKNEYDLRRQAEKNLAAETEHAKYWEGLTKEWYSEHCKERDRANKSEAALSKYSRPRDPRTGRFYSTKANATEQGHDPSLAAFDDMMGDPMSKLEGLTVRNLCDEVKNNAATGI